MIEYVPIHLMQQQQKKTEMIQNQNETSDTKESWHWMVVNLHEISLQYQIQKDVRESLDE